MSANNDDDQDNSSETNTEITATVNIRIGVWGARTLRARAEFPPIEGRVIITHDTTHERLIALVQLALPATLSWRQEADPLRYQPTPGSAQSQQRLISDMDSPLYETVTAMAAAFRSRQRGSVRHPFVLNLWVYCDKRFF